MTKSEIEFAKWCAEYDLHKFYDWHRWKVKRRKVLEADHYECQICKAKHKKYTRADVVHHVNHFLQHPELALEMYYTDAVTHERKRNLVSLCRDCHEEIHGRKKEGAELTEERWD